MTQKPLTLDYPERTAVSMEVMDVRKIWMGIAAVVAGVGLLLGSVVTNELAFAAKYPSWADVLKARQNIAQKEKAIA